MTKKSLKTIKLILINSITITRLIGSLILPFVYYKYGASLVSLFIIILFLTDAIDGFLARKLKCSTFFGSILDACSDKLLNAISFIILSLEYTIMLAPLIIEISIMYTIYSTYRYGGNVQASRIGKNKTIILDIFVILSFIIMSLPLFKTNSIIVKHLINISNIYITSFGFIILIACLIALFDYLRKNTYARLNPKSEEIKVEHKKKKSTKLLFKQLFDTNYYSKHKDESIMRQFYV